MPRGKKTSNRPSAGGIKRNDYHRRNRKRPASMFCTSHGYQTSIRQGLTGELKVIEIDRESLERRAVRDWEKHNPKHTYEADQLYVICIGYIRHRLSNYDRLASGLYGEPIANLKQLVFTEIGKTYPWLADKCEAVLAAHLTRPQVRIVKRPKTLTALLIEEHNEREHNSFKGQIPEDDTWRDEVNLHGALSSLASSRLMYLPPFLSREEIRQRRFGGQLYMNDNWWEWEQEKNVKPPEREQRFRWST